MQVSKSSQTRISGNNEVQLRFHIVKRNRDQETVNCIIHKVEWAFCNWFLKGLACPEDNKYSSSVMLDDTDPTTLLKTEQRY